MSPSHPRVRTEGIRLLRILWRLLPPLTLGAFVVLASRWLGASAELREQADAVCYFLLGYGLLYAITLEVLSPLRPELRLLPISDERARRLATIVKWVLIFGLGGELAIYVAEANTAHPSVPALLKLVRNVGLLLFAWLAVSRSGLLRHLRPAAPESAWAVFQSTLVRFVFPFAMVTSIYYLVTLALGYHGLAHWALVNAAWTASIVVAARLLYHYLHEVSRDAVRFIHAESQSDSEASAAWIGVHRIIALLIKVTLVIAVVFLVQTIWDLRDGLVDRFLASPLPFATERTWADILHGVVSVVIVVIVGRVVRDVLVFIVFPRAETDVGARYATVTVLKYVVILVSFVVGATAVGIDMSAVTVFAGGAGVGLSFALKDVLANFFSGLIMLFERPVKVGDEIQVGSSGGWVEAIRLRGTVIRAYDGTTIIIPNQQMIGERLENKTGELETFRVAVPVGVAYGSDMEQVQRLLLEVAKADARVVETPAPFVRFVAFGNSSVDFILRAYTRKVGERWALQSDLSIAVHDTFAREGIQIPFPQADLHVKSDFREDQRL